MQVLDDRVRDVLRGKYKLGLFDHPYVDPAKADEAIMRPESIAVALQASRESLVLLKNDKNALPLKKSVKKILVCGPNADDARAWDSAQLWCGSCHEMTTVGRIDRVRSAKLFRTRVSK